MSGGLTILIAKGQQDTVLTERPQISFFRQNYKRHVNFSQALLSQVIQGNPMKSAISTIKIDPKGDLLSYMYLTKKINNVLQDDIDEDDIAKVELIIGEQVVDTLTTDQLVALSQFNSRYPRSKQGSWVGGKAGFHDLYHYPLGFWFCQEWQSALPLLALQYHDIHIRITWGPTDPAAGTVFEAWSNFIYLDDSERKYILNRPVSDTLMYQHSTTGVSNSLMTNIPFNNPVSFLFTGLGTADLMGQTKPNISDTLMVRLNGVDIVDKKELYPHYNILPLSQNTSYGIWDPLNPQNTSAFIYSFGLNCSQLQPTGSCNFSRIDDVQIVTSRPVQKPIYGRSYNVLRIKDGMGGLLFSS